MADKLISELLDLPTQVRKGDFILNLARGVTEPEVTLKSYYATPQLQESFDDSLNTNLKINNFLILVRKGTIFRPGIEKDSVHRSLGQIDADRPRIRRLSGLPREFSSTRRQRIPVSRVPAV